MNTNVKNTGRITVKEVSEILGFPQQLIRIAIQRGRFDFGIAEILPNSSRYTYFISREKFLRYLERERPDKYKELQGNKEIEPTGKYRVVTDPAEMTEIFKVWRCN